MGRCAGGRGLGVAPIFPQLREYKKAGNRTISIVGFRNRELMFWEDRFREFSDELMVTTDDGSYGRRGSSHMRWRTRSAPTRTCARCGHRAASHDESVLRGDPAVGIPTIVSLNSIMVDGTGMCGSCRVTVDGKMKFACVDGADFDGHLVNSTSWRCGKSASSTRRRRRWHGTGANRRHWPV